MRTKCDKCKTATWGVAVGDDCENCPNGKMEAAPLPPKSFKGNWVETWERYNEHSIYL